MAVQERRELGTHLEGSISDRARTRFTRPGRRDNHAIMSICSRNKHLIDTGDADADVLGQKGFNLVIFDCDGVLVDSEVLSCRCLVEVLGRYGVPISLGEAFDRFLGRSSTAVEEYFLAITGSPLPLEFHSALYEYLSASYRSSLQLMPHIRAVLDAVDCAYCLASSSDADRVRMTLAVTGLDRYFGERVYTAAMVAHGKPAPDLFLLAAAKMRGCAAETLVIEDSVNGVVAGKAAGMTVWGFTGGSHYVDRDGSRLLSDAGADRVFNSMADLLPDRKA